MAKRSERVVGLSERPPRLVSPVVAGTRVGSRRVGTRVAPPLALLRLLLRRLLRRFLRALRLLLRRLLLAPRGFLHEATRVAIVARARPGEVTAAVSISRALLADARRGTPTPAMTSRAGARNASAASAPDPRPLTRVASSASASARPRRRRSSSSRWVRRGRARRRGRRGEAQRLRHRALLGRLHRRDLVRGAAGAVPAPARVPQEVLALLPAPHRRLHGVAEVVLAIFVALDALPRELVLASARAAARGAVAHRERSDEDGRGGERASAGPARTGKGRRREEGRGGRTCVVAFASVIDDIDEARGRRRSSQIDQPPLRRSRADTSICG